MFKIAALIGVLVMLPIWMLNPVGSVTGGDEQSRSLTAPPPLAKRIEATASRQPQASLPYPTNRACGRIVRQADTPPFSSDVLSRIANEIREGTDDKCGNCTLREVDDALILCDEYLDELNKEIAQQSRWPDIGQNNQISKTLQVCGQMFSNRRTAKQWDQGAIRSYQPLVADFRNKDWDAVRKRISDPHQTLQPDVRMSPPGQQKNALQLAIMNDAPADILQQLLDSERLPVPDYLLTLAIGRGNSEAVTMLLPKTHINAMSHTAKPVWASAAYLTDDPDYIRALGQAGADFSARFSISGEPRSLLEHMLLSQSDPSTHRVSPSVVEALVRAGAPVTVSMRDDAADPDIRKVLNDHLRACGP